MATTSFQFITKASRAKMSSFWKVLCTTWTLKEKKIKFQLLTLLVGWRRRHLSLPISFLIFFIPSFLLFLSNHPSSQLMKLFFSIILVTLLVCKQGFGQKHVRQRSKSHWHSQWAFSICCGRHCNPHCGDRRGCYQHCGSWDTFQEKGNKKFDFNCWF